MQVNSIKELLLAVQSKEMVITTDCEAVTDALCCIFTPAGSIQLTNTLWAPMREADEIDNGKIVSLGIEPNMAKAITNAYGSESGFQQEGQGEKLTLRLTRSPHS